jgi:LacI family transcriptional regulator
VVASETIPGLKGVSTVTIDNQRAAYDATKFLLENGCRRIAYLSAGAIYGSSAARGLGMQAALQEAGLEMEPELLLDEGLTFKAGKRAANRLLQMQMLPDAIFAAADAAAIGVMHTFSEQGITAGRDISVMGFDNNSIAEYYSPALTTVAQPQMEIGRKAMELLLRKIKEPASEPEQILLPHQLVVRDSVKLLADQKPPQETR